MCIRYRGTDLQTWKSLTVHGVATAPADDSRLRLTVHYKPGEGDTLARDVRDGLTRKPKSLPPKHFYDRAGSILFDKICNTVEYYQTRTELALLKTIADDLVEQTRPAQLVELGSGAARKTRVLLDTLDRYHMGLCYVPVDVSQHMMLESGRELLARYPRMRINGLVADYERDLEHLPNGQRRLIVFLGSTIGNFEHEKAVRFISRLRECMRQDESLLLGVDLVKDHSTLNAAYNDAQGVTEQFNKNILHVINGRLGASFQPGNFDHVAFFNPGKSQIEMYLRSRIPHTVLIPGLSLQIDFEAGESILTEISRKFTRQTVTELLNTAGLSLKAWYESPDGYFGLALAQPSFR